MAVAASDPNQIWVGSGEPAERQSNGLGYGVYKSVDGGKTWQHLGLERTEEIAAIVIDPRDPQTVYVGATGHLWGPNPDRGVYKTTDGGRTWRKVLFVDDMTGCMDLGIDPRNPSILYATTWQRVRSGGAEMIESGPGSGIYKSIDGGEHWKKLTRGLPSEPLSKIALAVAQKTPGLVYAFVMAGEPQRGGRTSEAGGIFRSNDSGESWTRVSSKIASRTYYTHINVDPSNDQRLFILDLELWRSDDGGVEWVRHNMKHVHDDLHGFWIDPHDSDHLILGGDGGLDVSMDGGATWSQTPLPIAQFYDLDVDNQTPYWVYGGMQDTASWTGPSRTYDNDGITDHDWIKLRSVGDGMAIHPDPRDPNVVFLAQNSGNLSRIDLRTWTRTELQPSPEIATRLGLHPLRWDWTAPFIISSSDPDVLYVGANYVFRCRIGAAAAAGEVAHECAVISPDLSAQQDRPFPPVGQGYHAYGALFSLAQSPVNADVMWAGADDGPIHVSRDAGAHWTRVDGNGAFHEGFVSKIEPSRTAAGTAYVSYDLHYHDDPRPYLLKTTDFGATWSNITHDLPAWGSIYVVREDPQNPQVLYVGTESGLFVSIDGGGRWVRWKSDSAVHGRSLSCGPSTRSRAGGGDLRPRDLDRGRGGAAAARRCAAAAGVPVRRQADRGVQPAVHLRHLGRRAQWRSLLPRRESAVRVDHHLLPEERISPGWPRGERQRRPQRTNVVGTGRAGPAPGAVGPRDRQRTGRDRYPGAGRWRTRRRSIGGHLLRAAAATTRGAGQLHRDADGQPDHHQPAGNGNRGGP